jgi:hypothetical protein
VSNPNARQIRRLVTLAGGVQKFEVATFITDKGDLPFKELFVVTVTNANDPKQDVYARVAEPLEFRHAIVDGPRYVKVDSGDVTTINGDTFARVVDIEEFLSTPTNREVAVRQGRTTYLTSSIVLYYDTLASADAAYRQLIDRLSTLTAEWRTATGGFLTTPYQDYSLPVTAGSVEAERVAAWKAARDARVALEATRDVAAAEAGACETGCASDRILYDFLVADTLFLQRAKDHVTTLTETGSANVKTFVLNGSSAISYETLLAQKNAQLVTAKEKVLACESRCRELSQTANDAQMRVDTARRAENTALARVLDVCPTFVPTA